MTSPQRLSAFILLLLTAVTAVAATTPVIAPDVLAQAHKSGSADTLIVLSAKAPLSLLRHDSVLAHRRALVNSLRNKAATSQADLRAWLDAQDIAYQSFWIVNMLRARLTVAQIEALGARNDIARIDTNPLIAKRSLPQPSMAAMPHAVSANAWNMTQIGAPQVWAMGITGQGVVIGGEDTGFQWDHPALKAAYRGWNGVAADHNYNWHDAIHVANSACAANSPAPCDDVNHGTHTMGIMAGDDGGTHHIGVAPGARWIGCRNMDAGAGTPARYIECMQWMLAPTNLAGNHARPDLAPDIINNSWTCVASEGCTSREEIHQAVDAVVAGGIFFVAAAGNSGASGCVTITDAPATYDAAFVVGASTSSGTLASFSSRGPVASAALNKPDVLAPGASVYSSIPTNNYKLMSGTSMAAPHVAGTAALIMAVNPALRGHPQQVADILRATAVPLTSITTVCGGVPATTYPNPVQGYGQIDAYAAVVMADTLFADGFE